MTSSPQNTETSTTATRISRFAVPELASLPDDIRERIEAVAEKSGFIPNVFMALANRPEEFRAFFQYHDTLIDKSEGLSKAERELIIVATSAVNDCSCCVIAHGAILRIRAKNPFIADQVAINPTNPEKANLSEREQHIVDFAMLVCVDSASVTDADIEAMREFGFSDEEIWDIGAISAFFALSNRMANFTGMTPNKEFYTLGRESRK